jgi:hypothetical protein
MATTFSSNIGSSSKGGFAVYTATTTDYFTAFDANIVTGVVTKSADTAYAASITDSQAAALTTNLQALLAAAIASGADPTANPLAYLSKLAGFMALDDGQTFSLNADNVSGDIYEFYADVSAGITPGTLALYIPNSAAAGLFTGANSNGTAPVTQRADATANIPGLPLNGAACLTVPYKGDLGWAIVPNRSVANCLTAATGAFALFRVEKYDLTTNTAPGTGTRLFDIRFDIGNFYAVPFNVDTAELTIPTNFGLRIVNPNPANATLADVSITIAGTVALP